MHRPEGNHFPRLWHAPARGENGDEPALRAAFPPGSGLVMGVTSKYGIALGSGICYS